ncbi:hypothetical protein [Niastella populi]|nr:hypothetical protein [Niastella populi]
MSRNIIIFIFFFTSCFVKHKERGTPENFINHVIADASIYSRDSVAILADLYFKMKNHTASFTNPEYFDSTVLFIDTIIYDSSLDKIAVFLVAQNPTCRNPNSRSKLPYYYNANCYLGKRLKKDSSTFDLKCLCGYSEINFNDYESALDALEEDFFLELATLLDEKNQPVYKYNVNDRRFWESPTGWKRIFK